MKVSCDQHYLFDINWSKGPQRRNMEVEGLVKEKTWWFFFKCLCLTVEI